MKQVEIDSDKYTTLAVGALLLFSFWEVVAHARDLFWLTFHPAPRTWPNFLISIFFGYVLIGTMRDRKLWLMYPYGAAGFGLLFVNLVLDMALPRNATGTVVMFPGFVGMACWLLIVVEIARWFRARVRAVGSEWK